MNLPNRHVINSWLKSWESRFEKSVHPHAGSSPAQIEMNRELVKDLIEWLDTPEGRSFIAHAFPETSSVIFPRQPLEKDPAYFVHLATVSSSRPSDGDGMAPMPRKTPIVFLGIGFIFGLFSTAALLSLFFLLSVLLASAAV